MGEIGEGEAPRGTAPAAGRADAAPGDPVAERAMAIVAHPDDADFLAAGTLAKWARAGTRVTLVVITDGSKGSDDPAMTAARLVAIRQAEQRAAAERLGLAEVLFLGYEDGVLEDTIALRRDLTRLIRQVRPDRLVCGDPTMRWAGQGYINHPDHIAAASAALAAVSLYARNRLSFPELLAEELQPHKVRHVYLAGTAAPDHWEDVGETIELKVAALQEHRSQVDGARVAEMIRAWARGSAAARSADGPALEYAETFKRFELG